MKCGTCHWFSTSCCSGLCTNPRSFKCGEYVGSSDYSWPKWEQKHEEETHHELKSRSICDRCCHKEVCSSIFKQSLWLSEVLQGRDPVCKHFCDKSRCESYKPDESCSNTEGDVETK